MFIKKIEPKKLYRFKRKIDIAYRYIKHYSRWGLLLLFLILGGTIIQKNYINKPSKVSSSDDTVKIKPYNHKPVSINNVSETSNDTKLQSLKKQLLAEKEKNKKLSNNLNNQEQQLVSALNNINQSYISTVDTTSNVIIKKAISTPTKTNQTDYYNKVRAALNNNTTDENSSKY